VWATAGNGSDFIAKGEAQNRRRRRVLLLRRTDTCACVSVKARNRYRPTAFRNTLAKRRFIGYVVGTIASLLRCHPCIPQQYTVYCKRHHLLYKRYHTIYQLMAFRMLNSRA